MTSEAHYMQIRASVVIELDDDVRTTRVSAALRSHYMWTVVMQYER